METSLQSFLRDYGAAISPTLAVVNGFIALVVAQFFKENIVAKILLVSSAAFISIASIGLTFYAQHLQSERVASDRAVLTQKQDQIGAFIAEGNDLEALCTDPSAAAPRQAITEWIARIDSFLSGNLGKSYVNRLNDAAGIPYLHLNAAHDDDHQNAWYDIYFRLVRLQRFAQEISRA